MIETCVTLGPNWRLICTSRLSLKRCPPPCHTYPAARSGTTWNGLVLYTFHASGHLIFLSWVIRFWIFALILVPNPLVSTLPATKAHLLFFCLDVFLKAGLLGCEAVLSSMALMQASSIAAPKKMMSPLGPASGHGSAQRDAQDRGMQGHMVLPTSMTCPPLVRRHLQAIDFRDALIDQEPELANFLHDRPVSLPIPVCFDVMLTSTH